jgi:hypothetical protein
MHPAWFRRHLEELPAAVVGIHDLWDRTEAGEIQGPLGMVTSKEKEKDAELIKEILLQKYGMIWWLIGIGRMHRMWIPSLL